MTMATPRCETCGNYGCAFPCQRRRPRTHDELLAILDDARHAMYAAVGFIQGVSCRSKESMVQWLVDTIKKVEDA